MEGLVRLKKQVEHRQISELNIRSVAVTVRGGVCCIHAFVPFYRLYITTNYVALPLLFPKASKEVKPHRILF